MHWVLGGSETRIEFLKRPLARIKKIRTQSDFLFITMILTYCPNFLLYNNYYLEMGYILVTLGEDVINAIT
jgi:hypothetical protein